MVDKPFKFFMVSYVACTDCENDKIWLTSHSSFVMVLYVTCTDCENDKIRWTSYSRFHTSRVQTVSVEGLMKFYHGFLRRVYGL